CCFKSYPIGIIDFGYNESNASIVICNRLCPCVHVFGQGCTGIRPFIVNRTPVGKTAGNATYLHGLTAGAAGEPRKQYNRNAEEKTCHRAVDPSITCRCAHVFSLECGGTRVRLGELPPLIKYSRCFLQNEFL